MATGTGKPSRRWNCIYEEFSKNKYYRTIILVPTTALIQWKNECIAKFNFIDTIFTGTDKDWVDEFK